MTYQPSLPSHNDNVAQEHPLKDFLEILTGLAALALLGFLLLGLLVDTVHDRAGRHADRRRDAAGAGAARRAMNTTAAPTAALQPASAA